jgi:aminopeptidase S
VCGELPGTNDTVVMLGGHLDSVVAGPGINDNGSGVSTLLAMAEPVAGGPPPASAVRFCFWAAEEFGDIGSQQYVSNLSEEQQLRIKAYFNLDMVASPNAGLFVYDDPGNSPRSSTLSQQLIDALSARGHPSFRTDTGGASDHFSFEQAGIPVGGVFSGISPLSAEEAQLFGGVAGAPADPCYHLSCDTRANTDTGTALILGTAVADLVSTLAY